MSSMTTDVTQNTGQSAKASQDSKGKGSEYADQRQPVSGHVENIKQDVGILKDDIASAATEVGHMAQEKAEQAMDVAKAGGDRVASAHESLCNTISERPTASVLVALGAGVLIGRILGGR